MPDEQHLPARGGRGCIPEIRISWTLLSAVNRGGIAICGEGASPLPAEASWDDLRNTQPRIYTPPGSGPVSPILTRYA